MENEGKLAFLASIGVITFSVYMREKRVKRLNLSAKLTLNYTSIKTCS